VVSELEVISRNDELPEGDEHERERVRGGERGGERGDRRDLCLWYRGAGGRWGPEAWPRLKSRARSRLQLAVSWLVAVA